MTTSTGWSTIRTPNSDDWGGRIEASVMAEITSRSGRTAAYTYTKDSSGKITKITPNFSVNFRDDSGKGAYTYTKDSSGKITKTTPNMVISYAK